MDITPAHKLLALLRDAIKELESDGKERMHPLRLKCPQQVFLFSRAVVPKKKDLLWALETQRVHVLVKA